jgi:hypothetical protein
MVVSIAIFAAVPASAHLGDISYSEIVVKQHTAFYTLRFAAHLIPGLPPDSGAIASSGNLERQRPRVLDWLSDTVRFTNAGKRCSASLSRLAGPDANGDAEATLAFSCAEPIEHLRIEFHAFDHALPRYQNLVSIRTPEGSSSYVFTRVNPVLMLDVVERHDVRGSFAEFFRLGLHHVWTSYDYLVFLLALLLPGGSIRRLTGIVAAFTIAHSLTLSLAVLGALTLPSAPVGIAIAASVVIVAAENLCRGGLAPRWIVGFLLGLVHGFGLAGVLRAAGLPSSGVAAPLLSFNLGVEAGLLVAVLAAVPMLRWLARGPRHRTVVVVASWLVIAAGSFWIVERSAALLR